MRPRCLTNRQFYMHVLCASFGVAHMFDLELEHTFLRAKIIFIASVNIYVGIFNTDLYRVSIENINDLSSN